MHKEFVELSRQFADVIVPGEVHNEAAVDLIVTKVRAWVDDLRRRSPELPASGSAGAAPSRPPLALP